jgi:hypothetical protein
MPSPRSIAAPGLRWIAVLGVLASTGVVVGATRAGPIPGVHLPDGPLGLWSAADDGRKLFSVLVVVSIAVLMLAFVQLYRMAVRGELDIRSAVVTAACWSAPLLVMQPLLSLDAYSYVAQGQMVAAGLNPYAGGPRLLGDGPLLDAVAPIWRGTPAPYGPLSLAILRWLAELTGASHVPFILVLRLLAVASVAACTAAAIKLARPAEAPVTVVLVAANPVVVVHLIGGVHLDALLAALAAFTLLAVRRRWWLMAAFAAAVAFAVKLPGVLLVGYVVLARLRGGLQRRARGVAGIVFATAITTLASAALVPDGWGWIGVMDTPGKVRLVYTVPTLLGGILWGLSAAAGSEVPFAEVLTWARVACALGGGVAILSLLLRAGDEPNWRRAGALVGGSFVVLAAAAPVIHAWYVTWGLALVAACAGAVAQRWMVLLSVAVCFAALPDPLTRMSGGLAIVLALLGIVVGVSGRMLIRPEARGGHLARVASLIRARVGARDAAPTPPG